MKVKREYRTNILSFAPGGVTVVTRLHDGSIYEYDNVKYPASYIKKALASGNVADAWVKEQDETTTDPNIIATL